MTIAERISRSSKRTSDGEWATTYYFLVAGLLKADPPPPSHLSGNDFRWAARRLVELRLASVVSLSPHASICLSAMKAAADAGQPTKGADGRYLPGIATPKGPVPHLKAGDALFARWRAGRVLGDDAPPATAPNRQLSAPVNEQQVVEGVTKARPRRKGVSKSEAEALVRDWLTKHAAENPAGVTRDAVAKAVGVSTGTVSKTAAGQAFRVRRDADKKPGKREIPLTDAMLAVVPGDCQAPDELAALIEEQEDEEAEEIRRHKRRHDPS